MWGTYSQKATLPVTTTHTYSTNNILDTHTVSQIVICSVGMFVVRGFLQLKTFCHGLGLSLKHPIIMDPEPCVTAPEPPALPPPILTYHFICIIHTRYVRKGAHGRRVFTVLLGRKG